MAFTVYKHTSPSGKVYVGITSKTAKQRWGKNGRNYRNNSHFYNAINKYGWENFKHEILAEGLSQEEAWAMEIELIAKFKSNESKYGYNGSTGGEKSALVNKLSEESKKRIGDSHRGEKSVNYGINLPENQRKRISEGLKKAYAEGRRRDMKGTKQSKEWATNAGKAHKGMTYRTRNDARPIIQKKYGEVVRIFKSFNEVKKAGFKGRIIDCCKGLRTTSCGYEWEFM